MERLSIAKAPAPSTVPRLFWRDTHAKEHAVKLEYPDSNCASHIEMIHRVDREVWVVNDAGFAEPPSFDRLSMTPFGRLRMLPAGHSQAFSATYDRKLVVVLVDQGFP